MAITNGDLEAAEETKRPEMIPVVAEETEQDSSEALSTSRNTSGRLLLQVDPSLLELVSAVENSENVGDESDEDERPDRSHLFCWCLCDLVKACVICNLLCIGLLAVTITFTVLEAKTPIDEDNYDDDLLLFAFKQKFEKDFQITIIRNSIGLPMALLGILAAVRFYKYLVLVVFLWYCAFVIWGATRRMYLSAFMGAFFAYPHLALFWTLHKGKLTRENYASLKKCC